MALWRILAPATSGKTSGVAGSNGMRLIALGTMTIYIPADPLTDFCAEIFARVGCRAEEADRVSASLVDANLTGHDSHGVIRVPRYVDWVRTGDLVPNQSIERLVDTPVIGVLDGRFGFGQTMAPMAVDIGVEKASATGLSAISLRNSGHVGRVGEWAERAAAAGLISIHFVNAAGSILVAPFGGLERRLSTAPFCVGFPREGAPPIVLDFATSLVAEGKVNVASHGGKPLPPDALIGPDGALSGDPALIYGPLDPRGSARPQPGAGAMRAFGEHKGSGLALICELLGGSLTGNGATGPDRKFSNGMFSLYLDPKQVDPAHVFDADMTRYLDWFQQGEGHSGRSDHDARRTRAREPRKTRQSRRAAVGRGVGVDRRGGAKRWREPGPRRSDLRASIVPRMCRFWTGRAISGLAPGNRSRRPSQKAWRARPSVGKWHGPCLVSCKPKPTDRLRPIPGRRPGAGRGEFR